MPVPLIRCRHRETGAPAEIPETALYLFADFEPIDQPEPEQPDGEAEQTTPTGQVAEPAEPAADKPSKQASAGRTSKAAASAKKTEED